MTNLAMGGNAPIESPEFVLDIHLPQGTAIDVSALQLYAGGKVRSDSDMCFFNQRSIGDGAIALTINDAVQSFSFDLPRLGGDVEKVVVTATLETGQFSAVGDLKVTSSSGVTILVETSGRSEAALIVCEIYKRNGQWKIRNVSQGFNGGLQALVEHFGVEVAAPGAESASSANASGSTSSSAPTAATNPAPPPASSPSSVPAPPPTSSSPSAPAPTTDSGSSSMPAPAPSSGNAPRVAASGMFDRLKQTAGQARSRLASEASKFKNRSFMEAVVNGCVLVAAADGSIDAAEKQKMAGFIERSDELEHFDMREVIDVFKKAAADFEADSMFGKTAALEKVGKVKSNADQSRLLVRVVCAIGAADGDFDAQEKEMVVEIARVLGLDASEFGV